ncbi:hypothetical protein GEMRC1_000343 [Eukaryota sp. GEM-RC1]
MRFMIRRTAFLLPLLSIVTLSFFFKMDSSLSSSSLSRHRLRLQELTSPHSLFVKRRHQPDLTCSSPLVPPPSTFRTTSSLQSFNDYPFSSSYRHPSEYELKQKEEALVEKEKRLDKLKLDVISLSEEFSSMKKDFGKRSSNITKGT